MFVLIMTSSKLLVYPHKTFSSLLAFGNPKVLDFRNEKINC